MRLLSSFLRGSFSRPHFTEEQEEIVEELLATYDMRDDGARREAIDFLIKEKNIAVPQAVLLASEAYSRAWKNLNPTNTVIPDDALASNLKPKYWWLLDTLCSQFKLGRLTSGQFLEQLQDLNSLGDGQILSEKMCSGLVEKLQVIDSSVVEPSFRGFKTLKKIMIVLPSGDAQDVVNALKHYLTGALSQVQVEIQLRAHNVGDKDIEKLFKEFDKYGDKYGRNVIESPVVEDSYYIAKTPVMSVRAGSNGGRGQPSRSYGVTGPSAGAYSRGAYAPPVKKKKVTLDIEKLKTQPEYSALLANYLMADTQTFYADGLQALTDKKLELERKKAQLTIDMHEAYAQFSGGGPAAGGYRAQWLHLQDVFNNNETELNNVKATIGTVQHDRATYETNFHTSLPQLTNRYINGGINAVYYRQKLEELGGSKDIIDNIITELDELIHNVEGYMDKKDNNVSFGRKAVQRAVTGVGATANAAGNALGDISRGQVFKPVDDIAHGAGRWAWDKIRDAAFGKTERYIGETLNRVSELAHDMCDDRVDISTAYGVLSSLGFSHQDSFDFVNNFIPSLLFSDVYAPAVKDPTNSIKRNFETGVMDFKDAVDALKDYYVDKKGAEASMAERYAIQIVRSWTPAGGPPPEMPKAKQPKKVRPNIPEQNPAQAQQNPVAPMPGIQQSSVDFDSTFHDKDFEKINWDGVSRTNKMIDAEESWKQGFIEDDELYQVYLEVLGSSDEAKQALADIKQDQQYDSQSAKNITDDEGSSVQIQEQYKKIKSGIKVVKDKGLVATVSGMDLPGKWADGQVLYDQPIELAKNYYVLKSSQLNSLGGNIWFIPVDSSLEMFPEFERLIDTVQVTSTIVGPIKVGPADELQDMDDLLGLIGDLDGLTDTNGESQIPASDKHNHAELAYVSFAFRNAVHHLHLHLTGDSFLEEHEHAEDIYDLLLDFADYWSERAIQHSEDLENFNNIATVSSLQDFLVDEQQYSIQEYAEAMIRMANVYLGILAAARPGLPENEQSDLDGQVSYINSEIIYKLGQIAKGQTENIGNVENTGIEGTEVQVMEV